MLGRLLLLITLVVCTSFVNARAESEGAVSASVSYINFGGKSWGEGVVGASYRVNDNVDVRGIASLLYTHTDNRPRINIGLVDIHTSSESIGLRLGRVEHIQGFFTAQYNWPSARDQYMPTQGAYMESLRYFQRSGDGVQVYAKHTFPGVHVEADATYAKPIRYPMNDVLKPYNGLLGVGEFTGKSRIAGLNLKVEFPQTKTTFRYGRQKLSFKLVNSGFGGFADGDLRLTSQLFGVRQELTDSVDVTLEYDRFKPDMKSSTFRRLNNLVLLSTGIVMSESYSAVGYNLAVGYQVTPQVKVTAGLGRYYSNTDYPKCEGDWPASLVPKSECYIEDNSLAVKYRAEGWQVIAEVHKLKGLATMPFSYVTGKTKERNTLWVLSITKTF